MSERRIGAFVVSGCASGIGRAISAQLLTEGQSVFGLGRDINKLQAVASTFPKDRFAYCAGDLADPKASLSAIAEIHKTLNQWRLPLLGLVNNAGVFDRQAFTETSDAIWERHFYGNLLSAVRLTRELHGKLKSTPSSSVVNISSTLGLRPVANTAAYSALKAAMVNWSKTLALEWATDGIRVNCLCPGLVDTPIHDFHAAPENTPARLAAHKAQPLGRMGSAQDIAEACCFLLSNKSTWTTGTVLVVDGGISL